MTSAFRPELEFVISTGLSYENARTCDATAALEGTISVAEATAATSSAARARFLDTAADTVIRRLTRNI
jgi:hypothetical protein